MNIAVNYLLIAVICFGIAELFGRSKHLGRWWMFSLMVGAFFVPGIIAFLFSPQTSERPTEKNDITFWVGVTVFLLFGVIGLIPAFFIGFQALSLPIAFIILGSYLTQLGRGMVVNRKPKQYFNFQKPNYFTAVGKHINNRFNQYTNDYKAPKYSYYFLVENGLQSEPYTFEQLKEKRIGENDLVWRKGLSNWIQAKELKELNCIIIYTPPILPNSQNIVTETQVEPEKASIDIIIDKNDSIEKVKYKVDIDNTGETGFFEVIKLPLLIFLGILIMVAILYSLDIIKDKEEETYFNNQMSDAVSADASYIPGQLERDSAIEILTRLNIDNIAEDSALKLLYSSLRQEFQPAIIELGSFYHNREKYDSALYYLTEASKQGSGYATHLIGYYYNHGLGVKKDKNKAISYYRKNLAIVNNENKGVSANNLGSIYYENAKYDSAYKYFNIGVELGYINSHDWLGEMYYNGYFVKVNNRKAFKHYKQALPLNWQSNSNASPYLISRIAYCFEYGIGTKQNLDSALYYYKTCNKIFPNDQESKIAVKRVNQSITNLVYQKALDSF